MTNIWCKVCGEALEAEQDDSVVVCRRCGAKQALPLMTNDEYLEKYAVLRELQQDGEQEKALALYEEMLTEGGSSDPVLHWTAVMAAYGAVYHSEENGYALTCNDAGSMYVNDNELYRKVLELATPEQREVFELDCMLLEEAREAAIGDLDTEEPINRGFAFLEDGAWDAAAKQFNSVIAAEPENALAYFGKMMAELQVYRESDLRKVGTRLTEAPSYSAVQAYGDELLLMRLNDYHQEGVLYQAAELGKCAETIDEWKYIKKLLMSIIENDRAKEYLSLCERKIRAIMSREAQLVIGCREAVNLGLTTETLGTRMVSANYYYDFDMHPQAPKQKGSNGKKFSPERIMIIGAVCILVIVLLIIFVISPLLTKDDSAEVTYTAAYTDNNSIVTTDVTEEHTDAVHDEAYSVEQPFCIAASRAFTLENGKVRSFTNVPVNEVTSDTLSGASFAGNVAPYSSDWSVWDDVTKLYSDPDRAMLFAVMENGTVAYHIFSKTSQNYYEDTYRAVSAWRGVTELIWETGSKEKPCLYAITKEGGLYASDAVKEEILANAINPMIEEGVKITKIAAHEGSVHILLDDGSYISVTCTE